MGLFSTLFPGVRDDSKGTLTAARDVCTIGVGGAAAALIAKAVGTTAITANPISGFLYCASAVLVDNTVGFFIRSGIVTVLAPNYGKNSLVNASHIKAQRSPKDEATFSVLRAADVIAKVASIALTTFAISFLVPQYALAAMTGLLTCAASITLNALFDASMVKIGVVK